MKTPRFYLILILTSAASLGYSAVHLSSDKTGSAIIVPFYTVSNEMNTLLSLTNTTDDNKAVKVHIKDAYKGESLLSFNVYLTGQDIWTFGMASDSNQLWVGTGDTSCTQGFPDPYGTIMHDSDQLWENGTIEIIEMGTVADLDAFRYGEPNCEELSSYWQTGQMWGNDSEDQLSAATGGLHAEITLIEIHQGHSANIPVIHLNGFFGENNIQHTAAGHDIPNLASGTHNSLLMHQGNLIETTWPTGYEAVSALLMKSSLSNEFNAEPEVSAQSELIVSFPTLAYHKNNPDSQSPFSFNYGGFWFPYLYGSYEFINREGTTYIGGCATCDPPPPEILGHLVENFMVTPHLSNSHGNESILSSIQNGNLNVLSFFNIIPIDFINGKVNFELTRRFGSFSENNRGRDTSNPSMVHTFYGLPVVGFSYTKFTNANAQPGLLAQYAFVRKHIGTRKIEASTAGDGE